MRGANLPPVEKLAIERVTLGPEGIVVTALNDGPDPVTIAQVVVDDAFWAFRAEPGTTVAHLGRTTITIPTRGSTGSTHAVQAGDQHGAHVRSHDCGRPSPRRLRRRRLSVTLALIGV